MNTKQSILFIILGIDLLIISLGLERFEITENTFLMIPMRIIYIFAGILLLLLLLLLLIRRFKPELFEKIKPIFFEEEFNGEEYVEQLRDKIVIQDETSKKDIQQKDIMELMFENMKEIKDYYTISKKQATKSFTLAVWLCIIGFIFIIASIVLITIFKTSIAVSIIPGIAGSVIELIAGTALVVYKTSLEQLNNYYESLHNNERFLSLVNLVSKLSDKKQDEAYLNIINTELQNYRKQ